MFTHIRTSFKNKQVVSDLTRKLSLGAENVIARIAIAYSMESGEKLFLSDLKDARGKEYTKNILFGTYYPIYEAMICTFYHIKSTDRNLSRYFKLHLDNGLEMIAKDLEENPNLVGFDYLADKIREGLGKL